MNGEEPRNAEAGEMIPIPSITPDGGGSATAGEATTAATSTAAAAEVPAPVPDVILSLVKDARYVGYTTELLADVVRPWLPSASGNGNVLAILGPELNLLATLCHWALVRWRRGGGKSLGMDALGLSYEYVARPARAARDDEGNDNGGSSVVPTSSSSLVETFGGSATTAVLFVASRALVPYLLRRALRGGWSRDLAELSTSTTDGNTRDRSGSGGAPRSSPPSPSSSPRRRRSPGGAGVDAGGVVGASGPADVTVVAAAGSDSPAREMEGLRGSARLAAHEERRRLMIRRASASVGASGGDATSAGGGGEDGDGGDGPADGLRGDVEGETDAAATAGVSTNSTPSPPPPPPPPRCLRLSRRMRDAAWSILQKVALATDGNDLAATTTVTSNRGIGDATAGAQPLSTSNVGRFGAATVEALRWAARLHVALFLLNGKYNSFVDRAFRVRFRRGSRDGGAMTTTTISSRPSYGLVGALILLEVCASAAKASAVAAVDISEVLRALLLRHRRTLRRGQVGGGSGGGTRGDAGRIRTDGGVTGRELDREEGDDSAALTLEERVPSIGSSSVGSSPPSTSRSPAPTCGICMGRRGSPAGAPTVCGHVFCWGCIQRWMAGAGDGDGGRRPREWCPTCRTPCRPQDVLALYHF